MDDKTLKALGDPKRFLLLKIMSDRGYCVSALAESTGLSESAVSQHLKILREADLVYGVKRGYYTHYCVNKDAIAGVIEALTALTSVKREPCILNKPGTSVIGDHCMIPGNTVDQQLKIIINFPPDTDPGRCQRTTFSALFSIQIK